MGCLRAEYLVAVYGAHSAIHIVDCSCCRGHFAPDVIHIVGVNDTNNMPKLLSPALAMVEPGQMLWLLQNCYISLHAVPWSMHNMVEYIAAWKNMEHPKEAISLELLAKMEMASFQYLFAGMFALTAEQQGLWTQCIMHTGLPHPQRCIL